MTIAEIQQAIRDAAYRYGVPPDLAVSVARSESGFNRAAISSAGAIGIMQLMPGTASDLGVNPYDPYENIEGGVRYLSQMRERFGSWNLALAAYNAGPGRVSRGSIPGSTQGYVAQILSSLGFEANGGEQAPSRTAMVPTWPIWASPANWAARGETGGGEAWGQDEWLIAALGVGAVGLAIMVLS